MTDSIKHKQTQNDLSIRKLIMTIKQLWHYLLSKWKIIVICGFSGALVGLGLSFIVKPTYTAHMSFVLLDKSTPSSGLASLASSLGFVGLMSGGDAFSGDNLIEIIKSRYAFESTLLSAVEIDGKKESLADHYIKIKKYDVNWMKSNNLDLHNLRFSYEQDRESFTRTQDSVLHSIYLDLSKSGNFNISRKDKKSNIVFANFTSSDENFSKYFIETLINQTYDFYKRTKTAQSEANIELIESKADSIKFLYEKSLMSSSEYSQVNVNRALQKAAIPKIIEEYNAQLYGVVYAEILKNLETLKVEKARETPIFQIIDSPIFPLKKNKIGKLIGLVIGGFVGGCVTVVGLFLSFYVKNSLIES